MIIFETPPASFALPSTRCFHGFFWVVFYLTRILKFSSVCTEEKKIYKKGLTTSKYPSIITAWGFAQFLRLTAVVKIYKKTFFRNNYVQFVLMNKSLLYNKVLLMLRKFAWADSWVVIVICNYNNSGVSSGDLT